MSTIFLLKIVLAHCDDYIYVPLWYAEMLNNAN